MSNTSRNNYSRNALVGNVDHQSYHNFDRTGNDYYASNAGYYYPENNPQANRSWIRPRYANTNNKNDHQGMQNGPLMYTKLGSAIARDEHKTVIGSDGYYRPIGETRNLHDSVRRHGWSMNPVQTPNWHQTQMRFARDADNRRNVSAMALEMMKQNKFPKRRHVIEEFSFGDDEGVLDYEKPDWFKGHLKKNENIEKVKIVGKTQDFPPSYKIEIVMKDGSKIEPDVMDAIEVIDMFRLNGLDAPSEVERVAATMRENPDLDWF